MRRLSLRWQMTVAFSVLAAGALLLLGLYLESLVVRYTEANVEDRLRAETHLAAQVLPPPPWSASADLDRRVRELDQVLQARVTLIDPDGKVLADSQADATTLESHAGRPERLQALGQGWGSAVRFSATQRFMNEYVALALPTGSRRPSMLRLAVPLTTALAASQELRRALLLTLAVALLVILLVSARIAQALSRPVQRLVQVARRVARGDLQARVEGPAEGELGELSAVFNSALARLETLVETSQREAQHLAAVLEQMTDGVVVVDEAGHVRLVNQAFEEMFGLSASDAEGRPLEEVALNFELSLLLRRALERQTVERGEIRLLQPEPARTLYGVANPLLGAAGQTIGAVGLLRDVTERNLMDQVRRDFVANASHELRTPAAGIRALAEVLQEGALRDPDKAQEFVERILAEAARLTEILDDMLTLTRVERGPELLKPRWTVAAEALEEAAAHVHTAALVKGITLEAEAASEDRVYADPAALQTVLINLLDNAVKYTPEGGEVRMAGRRVPGGYEIAVTDSGTGIAEEHLSRIFERFYRADKARSRATGGTGLGLAIVKHIVEAHRGKVTVRSALDQGSTFTVFFPTAPE